MLKNERNKEILRQLSRDGEVTVEQLAERFEMSTATIRRELSNLEGAGLLRRTRGGAIQVEPMLYEPFRLLSSFAAQEQMHAAIDVNLPHYANAIMIASEVVEALSSL